MSTVGLRRLVFSAASIVALCTAILPVTGGADTLAVVRLEQLPGDDAGTAFYAQDLGYFKNAGLDVQFSMISSGPVAAQAVAGGAGDIGISNVATIAAARLRGIPLRFIAPAGIGGEKNTQVVVMVAKDSPYKTAADLDGKTFGVNAVKAMPQLSAVTWMDKHGGDSRTVKFVEIPFPALAPSLEAHRIDAAIVTEPFASQAKGIARNLGTANDGLAPNSLVLGYFASDTWLATHADVAARFVRAIRQASVWANAHRAESAVILARNSKMQLDVITSMERADYGVDLDPATVDPIVQSAAKYGIIDKAVPISDMIWKSPTP
jgi:NitT/TauT family transport system substrate-binding protein